MVKTIKIKTQIFHNIDNDSFIKNFFVTEARERILREVYLDFTVNFYVKNGKAPLVS